MIDRYDNPKFGVAGFPPAFFESPLKKNRANIFEWIHDLSLDWVELQNTYGVKMKSAQAQEYKCQAKKYQIGISLHAPYYITLASGDPEVVTRSIERIFQCIRLAEEIGSQRIIFHPGHFPGSSDKERAAGLAQLINQLRGIQEDIPKDIFLYAETAGKKSQLGSVEEIIEICSAVSYVKPCLDLAHIHAFRGGGLKTSEAICDLMDFIELRLGTAFLHNAHFHMYPVEVDKTGEKRHRGFHERVENHQLSLFGAESDPLFYPRPEHFVAALKYKKLTPVVVCEALNSQEKGALIMKGLYYQSNDST